MSESANTSPEDPAAAEFRAFLVREFGMVDRRMQNLAMSIARYGVLKAAHEQGSLPDWDPIEAGRAELIANGITDPELQRPILNRLYLELEDPRWNGEDDS